MSSDGHQLQSAILAKPFKPFIIRAYAPAKGYEEYQVRHPEFVAHRRGDNTAVLTLPDGSTKVIDLSLAHLCHFTTPKTIEP